MARAGGDTVMGAVMDGCLYYCSSKPLNLRASFPSWLCFIPVNVAVLCRSFNRRNAAKR